MNTNRVFRIFAVIGFGAMLGMTSLQADTQSAKDIQAEIDALEKENQLLELKRKNERLKAGQNIAQDSAKNSVKDAKYSSAESANLVADKSGAFGFCKGRHASTGCFIGGSVGLAFGENWMPIPGGYIFESSLEKNFVAVPVNIDFGWQWYYAQNAGFRFKGYMGYSNYNSAMGTISDASSQGRPTQSTDINISVHALQYGLEASYLYDFIYKGKHNFGAHVSTGFEGSTFMGQSMEMTGVGINYSATFPSYSKFTWTTGIGIHYFYKVHHQFFLSYLYRGYNNDSMVENEESRFWSDIDNQYEGGIAAGTFKLSTAPRSTIMLSYAYKF